MVNKKNILITGSDGQLGQSIKKVHKRFMSYKFYFTDKEELDITEYIKIKNFISENNISIIINCAAYTDVIKAESEQKAANLVNNISVGNISKICSKKKIQLIHISTDYVFDGIKGFSYDENDKPNPLSYYGKTKLKGEQKMLSYNLKKSIIIRTSWLFSTYGKNFLTKILNNLRHLNSFSVIGNEFGSPTNANDLACVILKILPKLKNDKTEIYHFSNLGMCSRYEFAIKIKDCTNGKSIITKKNNCEINKIRPKFSALNPKKIINKFDLKVYDWSYSLPLLLNNFINNKLDEI